MNKAEFRRIMLDGIDNLEKWQNSKKVLPLALQAARKIACCLVPDGRGKKVARGKLKTLNLPRSIEAYVSSLVAMSQPEFNDYNHLYTFCYRFHKQREQDLAHAIFEFHYDTYDD